MNFKEEFNKEIMESIEEELLCLDYDIVGYPHFAEELFEELSENEAKCYVSPFIRWERDCAD